MGLWLGLSLLALFDIGVSAVLGYLGRIIPGAGFRSGKRKNKEYISIVTLRKRPKKMK